MWDAAVVIDSDVLTDPDRVRAAVPRAIETGQMVVPFVLRHNLSPIGTRRIIDGDRGSWKHYIARTFRDQHSSVVAIPRTLYDDIGGFDEAFRGWGMEDTAFALACEVIAGRPLERADAGEVWHLHHATAPGEKHGSPSHRRNMARLALYRDAHARGDRDRIQALVAEGRGMDASHPTGIPRVLHRVVPERTPDLAEAWWAEWQRLHPGWRFLTHRDPLRPEDWPITSPVWSRVTCGAELADLVRLEALHRWGGIYVDMDVQPFRSLDPLLGVAAFAAWEDENVVPNAVMGAEAGHPSIRKALDLAIANVRKPRHSVWDGGPGVTTRLFPRDPSVLLLPPGSFYRVHYRDPDRDDAMVNLPPAPWEYGRHHYWGSWLPEDRRKVPA